MVRADHEQVFELFSAALELEPASRSQYLARNCHDPQVRSEVEDLLRHHASSAHLESPPSSQLATQVSWNCGPHLLGTTVAQRYRLDAVLGSGGQGTAFLACDFQVNCRQVVVKLLFKQASDASRSAFRREMEILTSLDHPGVVSILDAGEWEGWQYIAVQYVEGPTMRDLIAQGPVEPTRAASIVRQIGNAMAAVHAKRIAHRDLKPENILVSASDGRVRIIDFGIAYRPRIQTEAQKTTLLVAGTPDYMAPEQLFGEHLAASDVYAFGLIAFEMLTGRLPFKDTARSVRTIPRDSRIPSKAHRLIRKALAFDPAARPKNIAAFGSALADALERKSASVLAKVGAISVAALLLLISGLALTRSGMLTGAESYSGIIESRSGYDPLLEHFRELDDIHGSEAFRPDNSGYEGYRLSTDSQGFYLHPLTPAQERAAMRRGWTLTGRIRAEQGGAILIADFDQFQRRYDIFAFRNARGGTTVRLISALIPSLSGQDFVLPDTSARFHDYSLNFDPHRQSADLSVDGGIVLSGYRGHSEYVQPFGLVLGVHNYFSRRGIATFAGARLQITR